jgi:pSer/pThr/pTyr-binding forkhead associated (FHA) protein
MKLSLVVVTAGKAAGQTIPIPSAQFIIGRDPQCNLRPGSVMISKRHCALLVRNEQAFLRDFDSTNGTFLNDEQVKGEVPLKNGDTLKVGPLTFKVVLEGVPAPVNKPTPPPPAKKSDIMDDDAAALLLDLDGDEGIPANPTAETTDEVPGGTTMMDIPALQAATETTPETKPVEQKAAEQKPAEQKPAETKKKHAAGAAQDAAKALLEKLAKGRRK